MSHARSDLKPSELKAAVFGFYISAPALRKALVFEEGFNQQTKEWFLRFLEKRNPM